MQRSVIFWDVDTQRDFMEPDGKLYVPDAESIRPALERLTGFAHERELRIVASSDDHVPGHRELSADPDYHETFPEHCMRGTPGAEKIPETALFAPLIIEPDPIPHDELSRRLWSHGGDLLIRKHWFDVFTNPNTAAILELLRPEDIVVYGVALDVCDRYAIEGFLARAVPAIHLVEDATRAIHPEAAPALLDDWRARGVHIVRTADVVSGLVV